MELRQRPKRTEDPPPHAEGKVQSHTVTPLVEASAQSRTYMTLNMLPMRYKRNIGKSNDGKEGETIIKALARQRTLPPPLPSQDLDQICLYLKIIVMLDFIGVSVLVPLLPAYLNKAVSNVGERATHPLFLSLYIYSLTPCV